MIDIGVTELTFAFGERTILNNISFTVDSGQKVGLLGRNGCGKTTLLKLLTGEYKPESGGISIAPGKRLGLLSQIPVFGKGFTGEDVMRSAFERLDKLRAEIEALAHEMQTNHDAALIARYGKLSDAFEHSGGFETEVAFAMVKNGLRIHDTILAQGFDTLSGGERTRLNLARLLLQQTEILLLDEPTNHLDLDAVEWLEGFLATYKGTALIVSHDRVFLDNVITRVLELEEGQITPYTGNFSQYVAEKDNRRQHQYNTYVQQQRKIKQLLDVARVMHERGTEKQHKTAFAIEKRVARIKKVDRPTQEKTLKAAFAAHDFKGGELFALKEVSKKFDNKLLFHGVDLVLKGQERVAILGANGTGKTTLLKILLGQEPYGGHIWYGPSARIGYLPQLVEFEQPQRTLFDTLLYELDFSPQETRDRLGAFGFSGDDVFKQVGELSGGERSRLKLCMLMCQAVNLLFLDEPTNHLDLASRRWIEDVIALYDQAVVFVSHDRAFIERFAQRIWLLENQTVTDYPMNYTKYKAARQREQAVPIVPQQPHVQTPTPRREAVQSRKDKAQLRQLEKDMDIAEARLAELETEIENNASDAEALQRLMAEQTETHRVREELYEAWYRLSE